MPEKRKASIAKALLMVAVTLLVSNFAFQLIFLLDNIQLGFTHISRPICFWGVEIVVKAVSWFVDLAALGCALFAAGRAVGGKLTLGQQMHYVAIIWSPLILLSIVLPLVGWLNVVGLGILNSAVYAILMLAVVYGIYLTASSVKEGQQFNWLKTIVVLVAGLLVMYAAYTYLGNWITYFLNNACWGSGITT
ncbi:MAG: hypothetical protein AB1626_06025 [Candidatus Micrarchaeota archaeon]